MVPNISENEAINLNSNNVSLSYSFYSDYENETVPSISMTKKRKIESSSTLSTLFDLDEVTFSRALKTPRTIHDNSNDKDKLSSYHMAPRKSKKQILFISDDCIRTAPQFPLLDIANDDDSVFNLSIVPRIALFNDIDFKGEASPRLPHLDDDWIKEGDDDQKENRPPMILPRITKSSTQYIFI